MLGIISPSRLEGASTSKFANFLKSLLGRAENLGLSSPEIDRKASYGRRQEDLRRQSKPRQRTGKSPNYEDPKTLAYFSKGRREAEGPDILSEELLDLLRQHTVFGSSELGVLIDRRSAHVLQITIGQRHRVEFDEQLLHETEDIVVVHTHDTPTAFSAPDWALFIDMDNADLDIVVTPECIFTLAKTKEYTVPWTPSGVPDVELEWQRWFESLRQAGMECDAAIERLNQELAKIYGVEFKKYER